MREKPGLSHATWAAAVAVAAGRRPPLAAEQTINRIAAGTGPVPQLAGGLAHWRAPVTAAQLLVELARDAVTTFSAPTADRVRKCADPGCALHYLDTSRPGRRRWCSMQRCGNRNKVHQYRDRRQE